MRLHVLKWPYMNKIELKRAYVRINDLEWAQKKLNELKRA